jgi:hypothetical protein
LKASEFFCAQKRVLLIEVVLLCTEAGPPH